MRIVHGGLPGARKSAAVRPRQRPAWPGDCQGQARDEDQAARGSVQRGRGGGKCQYGGFRAAPRTVGLHVKT
ncbi:hypothetical protein AOX55_00002268 [Sinorhizobium fredii CCBAU 25509]|nr:hypothetical protein AOX55_00002268 [Sinorhizobium fredii CCBAU 25509]